MTRRAYEAGVRIAAGTDGMTAPDNEWPALFEEMEFFHDRVGMPLADVYQSASLHGAMMLGLADQLGTLEAGKYANVMFLAEDPLSDLESLRSVRFTLKRGKRFDRADFELGSLLPPPG